LTFRSGVEKGIAETYIKEEKKMQSKPPLIKGGAEGSYLKTKKDFDAPPPYRLGG
jgi:hypothetical protein